MSEEDNSSASGNACSASPSHQQQLREEWRGMMSGAGGSGGNAGSRSGGGPRSLLLKRSENGFGFTLRHFIVYPPESYTVLVPGCRSGCEPMDTMFVKSVRPNSPAARAGLQTGDRVVSVNGQTVTGSLTYAHVVHMISQSPKHLHLLVVPRQDDLLQLYFGDTAHNPETNPRVRLRSPSSVGVEGGGGGGGSSSPRRHYSPQRPPLLTTHHHSVPPLTPPLPSSRLHSATGGRLSSSECSSLSLEGGGGQQEWRRASDGGGGGQGGDGGGGDSGCSASSSMDSMSRADFHSSDDSLIIDRIRKSFEQKEEFLRRPVAAAPVSTPRAQSGGAIAVAAVSASRAQSGGVAPAAPIQWPAAIPASCVIKPVTTSTAAEQVVPWRTTPPSQAATPSRSKQAHLARIDESGGSSSSCSTAALAASGGGLVPVAARAQVFEEGAGAGERGVQLFRSELAGLSEKRSAPDVALRRRQFEGGKDGGGGGKVGVGVGSVDADMRERRGGSRGVLSRSLDMPCAAMSGNRTTPVGAGGSRLHCEPPPLGRQSPTPPTQGLVTSNSGSSIGAATWLEGGEWVTGGGGHPHQPPQQRHKAVRQDSYLAACHKPHATAAQAAAATNTESADVAVTTTTTTTKTADLMAEEEVEKKSSKNKKKKKLKSSSLRSAVRPTRLDLAKVARPLSCGGTPPPSPKPEDTKEDFLKQSPTEDIHQNTDVDQSHQKRVSYLKQIWAENANRTSPTPPPPPTVTQLSERLKQKKKKEEVEVEGEEDEGPLVVVEGSLMCKVVDGGTVSSTKRMLPSGGAHWKPVWAVLRGPVLHLMRLKQAETPAAGPGTTDLLADREEWWREDLVARHALIQQCALDSSSSKRGGRQVISVQVASSETPSSSSSSVQPALDPSSSVQPPDQQQLLLLQAADAISHQQWLKALHNVVGGDKRPDARKASEDLLPAAPQPQPQTQTQAVVQPQPQLPSPKCKTWKGRVAKQFRRIGQGGGGGGGSSPISPTAPPTTTTYQEGASIGVPLDWCPQSQLQEGVPLLVEVCCGEVESRGLEVVGVYRVPGNTAAVTALTEQVNRAGGGGGGGGEVVAQLVSQADVNVVSSLLKSLFRRLPDALLTSDLYPLFIAADKIADPLLRAATIRKLVHSLPDHHFETLRFVMAHLKRVVARSEVNKMEARNLAIVFGPTLVRTADDDSMLTLVTDMSHQCRIVETLILHADWCFSDDDIDRLQLASGGGSESTPALPPHTSDHLTDNHNLLLENIHKVQGMKSGGGGSDLTSSTTSSSNTSSSTNLKDISAKDIVVSIIGAANRKMHKSKSRSSTTTTTTSTKTCSSQTVSEDVSGGGNRGGVAASIRESVLFSGSILAASSHRHHHGSHGKKAAANDGVDGEERRRRSEDQDKDLEESLSRTPAAAVVDADGMIRTYTGLSACKQERIRRFEQETKAMLQRENAARGGGLGLEERSKRELDSSCDYTDASTAVEEDESPPSGEGDLLSSLTSTFDAKLRSLLQSSSSAAGEMTSSQMSDVITAAAPPMTSSMKDAAAAAEAMTSSQEEASGEAAFRDPSLHRSTSTTSATSTSASNSTTGQFYQLTRTNSNSGSDSMKQQQLCVNTEEEEEVKKSSVLLEKDKKKGEGRGGGGEREEEEEEEGEEKKDDSVATKDPLSCKPLLLTQDAAAATAAKKDESCKLVDVDPPLSCCKQLLVQDVAAAKKDDAASCGKQDCGEETVAAAAAAFVCKVRRSESLEKRALKNADDLLMGDSKISRRSSDRALKRSDSLTKSEKTESNLYRRRQQAAASQQQASKRKNGGLGSSAVGGGGGGASSGGGGGGGKCAIKRRHTVGGTKDFTWAHEGGIDVVETGEMSGGGCGGGGGSESTYYSNRRTSSPDLSRAAAPRTTTCCTHLRLGVEGVAAGGVPGAATSPLESHV